MNTNTKKIIIILLFLLASAIFYLGVFNSGYGLDAFEYLVIGRSLLDGYPFYTFVPSKSWALYYIIAAYLSLGNVSNHYSVSLLVTLIFSSTLLFTFFIVKKKFNDRVAWISTLLVGVCGVFMELNFLEPEGFVYIFGISGFYYISKAIEKQRNRDLIIGGFLIGIAFSFKVVAGFYWLASAIFIFFWGYFMTKDKIPQILKKELSLFFGLSIVIIVPLLYFALSGRLMEHLEWTYLFPLFGYPIKFEWFFKLYTKLLWFSILMPAAFIFSLKASLRKKIYSKPDNIFIILLGFISLVALFKTQASHYAYPGATFLSIFVAVVIDEEIKNRAARSKKKIFALVSLFIFLALAVSLYLYRPNAIRRLFSFNDYSYEANLKSAIQKYVPPDKKAIFFTNHLFLYWISDRYPNFPFTHLYVHFTYALEKNPEMLLETLSDPNLYLVEFNPESEYMIDTTFFNKEKNVIIMERFFEILNKHFVIVDTSFPPYIFWTRRELLNK